MKPYQKRLTILHQPEIQDLFAPAKITIEEKRFYFTLNDLEYQSFQSIRDRQLRSYFVLLLGYFKVKPVVLNFGYSDVRDDLVFIHAEYLPGMNPKRRNLTKSQRSRLYGVLGTSPPQFSLRLETQAQKGFQGHPSF